VQIAGKVCYRKQLKTIFAHFHSIIPVCCWLLENWRNKNTLHRASNDNTIVYTPQSTDYPSFIYPMT